MQRALGRVEAWNENTNNWVTEKETEFKGQQQEWKKKWVGRRILLNMTITEKERIRK